MGRMDFVFSVVYKYNKITLEQAMNQQIFSQEVYFEENEPSVEEEQIEVQTDFRANEIFSASCVVSRKKPMTATLEHRKTTYIGDKHYEKKDRQSLRPTFQRKMTFDMQSSPAKGYASKKNGKKYMQSNTSMLTHKKKPEFAFDSISPDSSNKNQYASISPEKNRKSLYWQSWLLEKKEVNDRPRKTWNLSSSLKNDRQHLPELTAKYYIAMMAKTNEILAQNNENQKREIASLTKIMTAYTVITVCNTYGINLKEHKITIHRQASFMEGTSANLRLDQEIPIIDLLYGLLLPSGNDAGIALAQYFGKFLSFKYAKDNQSHQNYETSMQKFNSFLSYYDVQYEKQSIKLFVFEMNKNSYNIGLKNTHFANPTGLSNSKNVSTAKDIALLTSHCMNNRILRQIFCKKLYICEIVNQKLAYKRQIRWKNTNKHLYQFKECIGVKTGITPSAGPCLSSAYRIMSKQIIIVVLNSNSVEDRYEDARQLYKWCRRNLKIY